MALAIGPQRTPARHWTGHVAGFLLGFGAGLLLTALLTMYVWPTVLPYGSQILPEDTGRATALVMAVVCGLAADVMVTARAASRRRL